MFCWGYTIFEVEKEDGGTAKKTVMDTVLNLEQTKNWHNVIADE